VTKESILALIEKTKPLTLLYVEDDPLIFDNTMVILNRFFDNIVFAQNGQEGLERFNESQIDIIISDINMPIMDGISMMEEIKQIKSDIPSILVTAHNERKFSDEAERLKIEGYLLKPIKLDNLFELLNNIVKT
jgi:YesN/AraC family two-component response regulator